MTVEWLAAVAELRYRPLILFAAHTGLRPCELVALRVGRLDLLRCTARVVEAAVEVSRLEWGPVKTHEARVVTCTSLLIAQGTSIKAVQAQLGHATASITLDTYGPPVPVRDGGAR